jgi:hypothetical protein
MKQYLDDLKASGNLPLADDGSVDLDATTDLVFAQMVAGNVVREWRDGDIPKPSELNNINKTLLKEQIRKELDGGVSSKNNIMQPTASVHMKLDNSDGFYSVAYNRTLMKLDSNRFAVLAVGYRNIGTKHSVTSLIPFRVDNDGKVVSQEPIAVTLGADDSSSFSSLVFYTMDNSNKAAVYGLGQWSTTAYDSGFVKIELNGDDTLNSNSGLELNPNFKVPTAAVIGSVEYEGKQFNYINASSTTESKVSIVLMDGFAIADLFYPDSNVSSTAVLQMVTQKGVKPSILGEIQYKDVSGVYKARVIDANTDTSTYVVEKLDNEAIGFVLSSGKVLRVSKINGNYLYSAHNSREAVELNFSFELFKKNYANRAITNIGVDTFMAYSSYDLIAFTFHINPETLHITIIDKVDLSEYGFDSIYTELKTAGADNEFLVISKYDAASGNVSTQHINVIKNPLKMSME